jgi:hypothetical protein
VTAEDAVPLAVRIVTVDAPTAVGVVRLDGFPPEPA